MCGICGVFALDGHPVDAVTLGSMVESLHHRGPDDRGVFVEAGVGLGHTRLSILDLSEAGHQPMADADGRLVIVFNGEIYNFPELRARLEADGVRFRSHSDTEVIIYLYRKYGRQCVDHLRGMFAFAIWDRVARELFIARDRIGIKPLYYYIDAGRFAFASEIKALCQLPGFNTTVDTGAVSTFFAYGHSFAPSTIYEHVRKLPPGHVAVVTPNGHQITRYWELPADADHPPTFEAAASTAATLLSDAVSSHLLADVPVGVFLSGGIDSSVIAALATRAAGRIRTFAVGFDVGGYYNELSSAAVVARHIGSDHRELVVKAFDVPDLLERLVWHYDEPFADAAAMPTYLLSQFARQTVKVALSGEGGDELYGGYRRYITQLLSHRYAWLGAFFPPGSTLRAGVAGLKGFRRVKKVFDSLDHRNHASRYAHWLTLFTREMRQELFTGAQKATDAAFDVTADYTALIHDDDPDRLNALLRTDLKTWLPDTYLEKVDKASMAAHLEARVPFLDHPVVEHAFGLPGRYKISRGRKKFVLRQVAEGLVPQEILTRPKHGFAVPLDEWFRGELLGYVREILLDRRVGERGCFDIGAIERLISAHVSRESDYGSQIWQLLNFELWHRRFVDQQADIPAATVPQRITLPACAF